MRQLKWQISGHPTLSRQFGAAPLILCLRAGCFALIALSPESYSAPAS